MTSWWNRRANARACLEAEPRDSANKAQSLKGQEGGRFALDPPRHQVGRDERGELDLHLVAVAPIGPAGMGPRPSAAMPTGSISRGIRV